MTKEIIKFYQVLCNGVDIKNKKLKKEDKKMNVNNNKNGRI
jgi:hypothetical protein